MAFEETACPIWGSGFQALVRVSEYYHERIVNCVRCGGEYRLDGSAFISELATEEKARLTTWLVDQRAQGDASPRVDSNVVAHIKNTVPLPVHKRADRLLKIMAKLTETVGVTYDLRKGIAPEFYAWTESTSDLEVGYFIDYLLKKGWVGANSGVVERVIGNSRLPAIITVTVEGHNRIGEQIANIDSGQAFIAMWFDDSMDKAFDDGIKPAIEDTGFSPMLINRKPDINKIDDEIIAEIRRSRFLVADFTHGESGARGSVYFEAGFAHGLGIDVIYTCRNDMVQKLHFDTRQYAHIVWGTPKELRCQLRDRILARIGQGPGRQDN